MLYNFNWWKKNKLTLSYFNLIKELIENMTYLPFILRREKSGRPQRSLVKQKWEFVQCKAGFSFEYFFRLLARQRIGNLVTFIWGLVKSSITLDWYLANSRGRLSNAWTKSEPSIREEDRSILVFNPLSHATQPLYVGRFRRADTFASTDSRWYW